MQRHDSEINLPSKKITDGMDPENPKDSLGEKHEDKKTQKHKLDFCFLEDSHLEKKYKLPYSEGKWAALHIRNHPLVIMGKHQPRMLKHPVCKALLKQKWAKFLGIFLFYNITYLVYLGLMTSYVLIHQNLLSGSNKTMDNLWITLTSFLCAGILIDGFDIIKVCFLLCQELKESQCQRV